MTILITGSGRGLGHFIAQKFIQDNRSVVLHRRKTTKQMIHNIIDYESEIICDLNDIISTDEQVENLKSNKIHLKHLICNAGKSSYKTENFDCFENVQNAITDNLIVTTNIIASTLKTHLSTLQTITIIGSICGEENIHGAPLEYSVSKASLKSFTKLAAKKLAKNNIRVNMVSPGNLFFEDSVWDRKKNESTKKFNDYIHSHVPLNRVGNVDDVYNTLQFLISEKSNYVTGANIVVDGGQTDRW
jgi:3-oxoacyl-[acyl-carrier protein] reductase